MRSLKMKHAEDSSFARPNVWLWDSDAVRFLIIDPLVPTSFYSLSTSSYVSTLLPFGMQIFKQVTGAHDGTSSCECEIRGAVFRG